MFCSEILQNLSHFVSKLSLQVTLNLTWSLFSLPQSLFDLVFPTRLTCLQASRTPSAWTVLSPDVHLVCFLTCFKSVPHKSHENRISLLSWFPSRVRQPAPSLCILSLLHTALVFHSALIAMRARTPSSLLAALSSGPRTNVTAWMMD